MVKKIALYFCVFFALGVFNSYSQTCTNTFITSFQPATAPANTVVTITGSGFLFGSGVSAVNFNGNPAVFTVESDTQITATVPDDATTGTITLTANGGCTATSATAFTALTSACGYTEIYISEIYDAQSGSPGAIELYNPSGTTLNFNNEYVLERYGTFTDANPTSGYSLTLTGSIPPYSTYLVRSGPAPCSLTIDPVMGSGINAQDAIKLRKNSVIIDAVHAPNNVGYTIIRNANAIAPAATFNSADWLTDQNEYCSNLGTHTANPPLLPTPSVLNPDPVELCAGQEAVFSSGVSGSGYTYQWKTFNAAGAVVNVTDGGIYAGATSDTFVISNTPQTLDGAQYFCVITSPTCTLYSYSAQLTIGTLDDPENIVTQPTCTTPGVITITAPVGTGYEYSIDGGDTWQTEPEFAVASGTYTIIVQNGTGCSVETDPITVDPVPGAPAVANTIVGHPDCDTATGAITINSPTGTGYQYSIDGGDTWQTGTVFEVPAGTYVVTTQNADGCTSITPDITVNPQPAQPDVADVQVTDPDCANPNGTLTVISPAGTGYEYSIDNGDTWQTETVFEVPTGFYTLVTKNAAGCTSVTTNIVVNQQPGAPAPATAFASHPDCDNANGTITITAPVGAGLQYSIDNGDTWQTETAFEVPAGTYTIITQNADGCTSASADIVVNPQPVAPDVADTTVTHPDCNVNGTITVEAPTGAGYQYSINGGDTWQASPVFNVPGGTYVVTTQNAGGCTSVTPDIVVNPQPAVPATAITSVNHPDCDIANGTISIISPTGTGYQYSIDNGDTWQTETAFDVLAGTYVITTQNANGCTSVTGNIVVNPQPTAPAAPALSYTPATCTTAATVTITSPTGTGFTYSSNGINYGASATFTFTEGTYNITVKNASGCISPATEQVVGPAPAIPATPQAIVQQPGCNDTTGTITVTAPAGTGITYSVNGTDYQASPVFTLTPGTYPVTAMNAQGCVSTVSIRTVNAVPTAPATPQLTAQQPLCGQTTGSITVLSPTGSGLTYSKDNGLNWQPGTTFGSLAPGTYSITVKNAAGCISAAATQVINQPPAAVPAVVLSHTQPDCTTAFGTITVTSPTGAGYTYSIDNGPVQTSPVFTPVAQGNHTITVFNSGGCQASAQQLINAAPAQPVVPVATIQQPDCDTATATVTVTAPLGGGHTYSLDGITFQGSPVFLNVAPGAYTLTVRNNPGCTNTLAITVNPQPAPAPSPGVITGNNVVCIDDTLQLANTATGGTWASSNTNVATVDATGLVTPVNPGSVTISYTVGTVCTDSATMAIVVTPLPNPAPPAQLYLCEDLTDGTYSPAIVDSNLPDNGTYTFAWEKDGDALPDTSAFITVSEPGTYTVTATNAASGCSSSASTTVGTSSLAIATAEVGMDFQTNQTSTRTVTGGSGDSEYSLEGGPYQDAPYFSGITDGYYTVTVRDKNGCGSIELEVFALNYPHYFSPNQDGTKDVWNIKGLVGQYNARVFIYDRYGKLISAFRPGAGGWDGTYNGHNLPATDYWFTVSYRATNGQDREFKAHFSLIR